MAKIISPTPANLALAANALKIGKLVAIPTETVYGLAADARNEEAIQAVFKAKERPANHPLIVHIGQISELAHWAIEIPEIAYKLAEVFWPGPLTFILKKHPKVSPWLTGGQDTVGIRLPKHPATLSLLKEFNLAVAAPSANKHCHISPTTAEHVFSEFHDEVAYIIDGGPCLIGVESTIIDLSRGIPVILRPGMLGAKDLMPLLELGATAPSKETPRVSGSLEKHYAPKKRAFLCDKKTLTIQLAEYPKSAVLALSPRPSHFHGTWFEMPTTPDEYARLLYAKLREMDASEENCILIENPPNTIAWLAIQDRLQRATKKI